MRFRKQPLFLRCIVVHSCDVSHEFEVLSFAEHRCFLSFADFLNFFVFDNIFEIWDFVVFWPINDHKIHTREPPRVWGLPPHELWLECVYFWYSHENRWYCLYWDLKNSDTHTVNSNFSDTHTVNSIFSDTHTVKSNFSDTHTAKLKFSDTHTAEKKISDTHTAIFFFWYTHSRCNIRLYSPLYFEKIRWYIVKFSITPRIIWTRTNLSTVEQIYQPSRSASISGWSKICLGLAEIFSKFFFFFGIFRMKTWFAIPQWCQVTV